MSDRFDSATVSRLLKITLSYFAPKNLDSKQKMMVTYRYVSWFITSIYYLTEGPSNSLKYKIAVVMSLFVFSRIVLDQYLNSPIQKTIRLSGMLETVGLILLLIPTGGIESPFIWYALNPILVASNYLKAIYCWGNLSLYLISSVVISINLFNEKLLDLKEFLSAHSYIILVFILTTIALRLLSHLVNQLDEQAKELRQQKKALVKINEDLLKANERASRSMNYILSLYHIIETFSSEKSNNDLLSKMVALTARIMESPNAFLWLSANKVDIGSLITQVNSEEKCQRLSTYFKDENISFPENECQFTIELIDTYYLLSIVKSSSRHYGYLGIELSNDQNDSTVIENRSLLKFLGELIAVVLERQQLERFTSKLMILEEQNRIGNEIHDSVSQRLFSILCGIHSLSSNWHRLNSDSIKKQLQILEQSTRETSKELRASIYGLSTRKRGDKVFLDNLQSYLDDFAALNNVKVMFKFDGEEEKIPSELKQALYRIIREATGNAFRHGKCSQIELSLSVDVRNLELVVKDNGKGFDIQSVLGNEAKRGLGLHNIQNLTQTFGGSFELKSLQNQGVFICIKIPLSYIQEISQKGGAA